MTDDKYFEREMEELKRTVDSIDRCLRGGHDNEPGLVAQVRELQSTMLRIMSNDLPHLRTDILEEIKKLQEKSVMWPSLGKNFAAPIIIAVITAIIVTLLNGILFQ